MSPRNKTLLQPKLLEEISSSLKKRIHTKREIVKKLNQALQTIFENANINIYLLDKKNQTIKYQLPLEGGWPFPESDKQWVIGKTTEIINNGEKGPITWFTSSRKLTSNLNEKQIIKDKSTYSYACDDGLFIILTTEEKTIQGIVFIHTWKQKKSIANYYDIKKSIKQLDPVLRQCSEALENLSIHKKIENLLLDKIKLKERIEKDEEDLKQRILELSTLHDTSNALSYTLNYKQVAQIIAKSIGKVLGYDICSIFLWDFSPNGEILTHHNKPLPTNVLDLVQKNVLESIQPFKQISLKDTRIKVFIEKHYDPTDKLDETEALKSFANVPLIFKEEVIGLLNICSTQENAFTRNEVTFIHTMANQLASNLGRLKMVKESEKSKMGSIVSSMTDGVLMLDENHHIEFLNPTAETILGKISKKEMQDEYIIKKLEELNLIKIYKELLKDKKARTNHKIYTKNKSFSVNISLVTHHEAGKFGTIFVFRDNTESDRLDQIKTQRLEIINKVNLVIKSIYNLDHLLTILMEFILNIAKSEMGSIQLKQKDGLFISRIHSNFPDKVRKGFRFKNKKTISEHVQTTKENCFIEKYTTNKNISPNPKILIDSYLCIPILVQNELIGIVNIARKSENKNPKISKEDVKTLTMITNLSGTAIQNALLYKQVIFKEKLDQELKVANQIQKRLLPETTPKLDVVDFGAGSFPAHDIGGDYYDFFTLSSGKIGIIVADIVGKGIPAGLFMAMLKSTLHTNILPYDSPQKALEKINKILFNDSVINKFVPAIYAILDPTTLELKYCNAGHEPGLILRKNKISILDSVGFPLGGYEEADYEEKSLILEDSDTVLLYTDGLVEARGNRNSSFGINRLKTLLRETISLGAQEIVNGLKHKIDVFSKNQGQHDDLTMIVIKSREKHKKEFYVETIKSKELQISSHKKNIPKIRKELQSFCEDIGFSDSIIFDIKLAVNEAHANIIEHAYFGSDQGMILFNLANYKNRIEIKIKDFAKNTSHTIKGEKKHLKELEGSGLGVYLINTLMDEVTIEKNKNSTELIIIKYKKGYKKRGDQNGSN
jgi:phosphoserine phosphatase RsbU/P